MLVESSVTYQAIFLQFLDAEGFELLIAQDGEDALRLLASDKFIDFICSSYYLRDMEGSELCRQVRQRTKFSYKPFVLLTSVESQEILRDVLPAGVTDVFLKKDIAQLLAYIKRFPFWNARIEGRVLYVEDSRSQREVLQAMLEHHGMVVDAFASADEAWKQYQNQDYDIVLTDVVLEDSMSGLNFVNRIRRIPGRKGDVPILALTAYDDMTRRVELFNMGVTDYLAKPLVDEDIFVRIGGMLKQQQVNERLRDSEDRHRIIFEHAAAGIARLALDGRFLQINEFWCNMLGYTQQEMLEATFQQITHPDDLEPDLAQVKRLLAGEIPAYTMEKRYLHRNGQVVWVHLAVVVQRDAGGEPLYFISVVHDITERKDMSARIADAAKQYERILQTTSDGFWLVGSDGSLLDVNNAYCNSSGYTREELLSMRVSDLEAVESPEDVANHIRKITAQGHDLFETRHRRKNGTIVGIEASVTYLPETGTFVSFLRDITERKMYEETIRQAKGISDEALSRARLAERKIISVSEETGRRIGLELHDDLGQLLTSIAFMAESLFRDLHDQQCALSPMAEQITLMMKESIAKTRNLAHGLYLADVEGGLHHLLHKFITHVESAYGIRCIGELEECCSLSDEFVITNLYRIAQEAVSNSIRHSGASEVTLRLWCEQDCWCLEISDNGRGLPAGEPLQDIGRGLGMHTMQYRATLIGATLDMHSSDTGATLRVCAPHMGEMQ